MHSGWAQACGQDRHQSTGFRRGTVHCCFKTAVAGASSGNRSSLRRFRRRPSCGGGCLFGARGAGARCAEDRYLSFAREFGGRTSGNHGEAALDPCPEAKMRCVHPRGQPFTAAAEAAGCFGSMERRPVKTRTCLSPGRSSHQEGSVLILAEEVIHRLAVDLCDLLQFDNIQPAFAELAFGEERVGLAQTPGHLPLEETCFMPGLDQTFQECLIGSLVRRVASVHRVRLREDSPIPQNRDLY